MGKGKVCQNAVSPTYTDTTLTLCLQNNFELTSTLRFMTDVEVGKEQKQNTHAHCTDR